jgi:hypothetical protein
MKKLFLTIFLLTQASDAIACSCGSIVNFDEAVKGHPILVHVRVKEIKKSGEYAKLEVLDPLKGKNIGKDIIVTWSICYHTISVSDLKIGHEYIFPFSKEIDGKYYLLGCSHSGAELKNGKLYTYEENGNRKRKLRYFLGYDEFKKKYGV